MLQKELSDLQRPDRRMFTVIRLGIAGLLYISMAEGTAGPGPAELLHTIAKHVSNKKQCVTRHCMRFSPVDTICRASLDAMEKAATQMVLPHFPPVLELPKTFAVQYDHRASAKFDRMAVINTVVSGIKQPPHKANLNNPDLTIIVQVLKNICAIGVAAEYRKYARYNFGELYSLETAPTKSDAVAATPDTSSKNVRGGPNKQAEEPLHEQQQ